MCCNWCVEESLLSASGSHIKTRDDVMIMPWHDKGTQKRVVIGVRREERSLQWEHKFVLCNGNAVFIELRYRLREQGYWRFGARYGLPLLVWLANGSNVCNGCARLRFATYACGTWVLQWAHRRWLCFATNMLFTGLLCIF